MVISSQLVHSSIIWCQGTIGCTNITSDAITGQVIIGTNCVSGGIITNITSCTNTIGGSIIKTMSTSQLVIDISTGFVDTINPRLTLAKIIIAEQSPEAAYPRLTLAKIIIAEQSPEAAACPWLTLAKIIIAEPRSPETAQEKPVVLPPPPVTEFC